VIYPEVTEAINLGDPEHKWKTLYCKHGKFDSIYVNDIKLENLVPSEKGTTA